MAKIQWSTLDRLLREINGITKHRELRFMTGYGKCMLVYSDNEGGIIAVTGMMSYADMHTWLWAYRIGLRHAFEYMDSIGKGV